ncbi:MAG TPA: hypothetical protein VNJ53_13460 [Gaiellaceae bacterium]|nr:hypothetical protein [Gaiellaceae bacterium]
MRDYGMLRMWAAALAVAGGLAALLAAAGTVVWAIEVDGTWPTLGVLFLGGAGSLALATVPPALSHALRALADVGETVRAG